MNVTTGRKTVAALGTPERLVADSVSARNVVIQAETDNTGKVAVGDANVNATAPNERGAILTAGQSVSISAGYEGAQVDLRSIFVGVSVNGDGVTFTAVV